MAKVKLALSRLLTSQPQTPLGLRQSILLAQSAYVEHEAPFNKEHVYVWAPAGSMSHPKSEVQWSSARQSAPNEALAMQS